MSQGFKLLSLYYQSGKSLYGKRILHILCALLLAFCLGILFKYGLIGSLVLCLLITMAFITPLLVDRYQFYLFIWLFVSPAFDNFREILIAGANPVVLAITGISLPFALILVSQRFIQVSREVPFIACLGLFNLVLFLNLTRPNIGSGVLLECLKIFIEIFIIFCGYHEIKSGNAKKIFNGINIFIIINSLIAIAQRVTGIGMIMVEGLPRVGGLVGHPNCLAFVNVLYIPFGIYKIVNASDSKEKKFWLAGVIISIIALLLTLCKNVILTFLLQSGILLLFLPNKMKVRVILFAALAFIILLSADFFLHLQFIEQFFNRVNNNSSLVWRLKIWGYLITSIDSASILFGHGVNAAKDLIAMINSRGSSYAHNAYLQLLYDYGLSGIFLILALGIPFIQFFFDFLCCNKQEKLNNIIPLLIIIAVFINMASDNSVFLRTPMVFAWLFLVYLYMMRPHLVNQPNTNFDS